MSAEIFGDAEKKAAPDEEAAKNKNSDDEQFPSSAQKIKSGAGYFSMTDEGLYFIERKETGEEKTRLCSSFAVVAHTVDYGGRSWGKLLQWRDRRGGEHFWAMPLSMLQSDSTAELRRELADGGLVIAQGKAQRNRFADFLALANPARYARCVNQVGWQGDVFVLADGVIGANDELVVYQSEVAIKPPMSVKGEVAAWRETLAQLASGNSRVMFAISAAFAGTLLEPADIQGGGCHLIGNSSTGKTTALIAACSVWGNPSDYIRTWRSTDNGLESCAALHNDGFLCLDEISEASPNTIKESVYMLANGNGKTRADQTGQAIKPRRWRLLFLSCGETSLQSVLSGVGKKVNAGDEVRLAEIEAYAGKNLGVFDTLNGYQDGSELANAIKSAAHRNYGAVGRAWLEHVVAHRQDIRENIGDIIKREQRRFAGRNNDGQVLRVAERFALVGYAGELAAELTGWQKGEAMKAAEICFKSWIELFGVGNRETAAILAHVRHFFELHGASRFAPVAGDGDARIPNRAGFYERGNSGQKKFLVLPEVFREELCAGFAMKQAIKVLQDAGWLEVDRDHAAQQRWLPEFGNKRLYVMQITD